MIGTNSHAICILQITIKLPDFSVQTLKLFVGKVSISVGTKFVFVVFIKLSLQQIVLAFMRPQKVPFVDFALFILLSDQRSSL